MLEMKNGQKLNRSADMEHIYYYPVQSVLYTCLYNNFLNVEAVQRFEEISFLGLFSVGTCLVMFCEP